MKKFAIITTVLLVVSLVGYPVAAQTVASISDLLANPTADQETTITGTVSSTQDGENDFVLSDGTGVLNICAGPAWHQLIALTPGEKVTVTGQMDLGSPLNANAAGRTEAEGPSIDAFTIVRDDGSTVVVRDGPGRPPWAGARGRGQGGPPASTETEDADGD